MRYSNFLHYERERTELEFCRLILLNFDCLVLLPFLFVQCCCLFAEVLDPRDHSVSFLADNVLTLLFRNFELVLFSISFSERVMLRALLVGPVCGADLKQFSCI